jgi:hypothetical protein
LKLSGTRLKLILKVSDVLTKIRGLLDWHCWIVPSTIALMVLLDPQFRVCLHKKGAQKGHTNRCKRQQKAKLLAMLIATPDEILQKGFKIGGFDHQRQQRVKRETCLRWFRALYGSKQSSRIAKCYSSSWLVNISPVSSFTVHL